LTDLAREDAHVYVLGRLVWFGTALALYSPQYHAELLAVMKSQTFRTAFTKLGVRYYSWLTRLTGSMETATANSEETGVPAYSAYRMSGCTSKEAWECMQTKAGIGGDDTILGDLDSEILIKAYRMFGHVVKTNTVYFGEPGVNFFSRMYSPNVWYGDLDSCSMFPRALYRFPVCARLPDAEKVENRLKKALEKSLSIRCTDANTPILGELAAAFVKHVRETPSTGDSSWWSQYHDSVQYPNLNLDGWMNSYIANVLPTFDFMGFTKFLQDAESGSEILDIPMFCTPIEPAIPEEQVIAHGEVIEPTAASGLQNSLQRINAKVAAGNIEELGSRFDPMVAVLMEDPGRAEEVKEALNQCGDQEAVSSTATIRVSNTQPADKGKAKFKGYRMRVSDRKKLTHYQTTIVDKLEDRINAIIMMTDPAERLKCASEIYGIIVDLAVSKRQLDKSAMTRTKRGPTRGGSGRRGGKPRRSRGK
jgi:hypothetical protein